MRLGCHCHTHTLCPPQLAHKRIHKYITPKQFSLALFSSSEKQLKQQTVQIPETDKLLYNVKLKTLGDCKLGISRYPDFEYNGDGGSGLGTATVDDSDAQLISVDFDTEQLYIPPLSSFTTKLLGLPLPPFLRIDIVPEALRGKINQQSGKVHLQLSLQFQPRYQKKTSVESLYQKNRSVEYLHNPVHLGRSIVRESNETSDSPRFHRAIHSQPIASISILLRKAPECSSEFEPDLDLFTLLAYFKK